MIIVQCTILNQLAASTVQFSDLCKISDYCNTFRKLRPQSVNADKNIIFVSENSTNSGKMEAVKLPSISGPSPAKELRPHLPPQKKVKSVSAHQNIFSVSKNNTNSGKMKGVKLSFLPAKELCPHPPPQKKVKSVSAHQNIFSVSKNTTNPGNMEAVKLSFLPGLSPAKELFPHPPPQKKVKRFSAHQNIFSVSKNTTNPGKMEAVKLPSIPGPSPAEGLRPHPPPQKKVNESRLSAKEQFQLFGLRSREDRTGEDVRAFTKEGQQRRKTKAQSKTGLLPRRRWVYLNETISDYKAGVLGTARHRIVTTNAMEAFRTETEQISQERRKVAQQELEIQQDLAATVASVFDLSVWKTMQIAQDSLVQRLRKEDEKKALLRKNYHVEDMIEAEELRLSEAREQAECEARQQKLSPEERDKLAWDFATGMTLSDNEVEVLLQLRKEKDKLNHYADFTEEEKQSIALLFKQEQKRANKVKTEMETINHVICSPRIKFKNKVEALCEELVKLQEVCSDLIVCSAYPLMALQQIEEFSLDSLDSTEFMEAERIRELQNSICQQCKTREQEQKRMYLDALLEERRQKRLARKLCPPMKPTGRKLMQRSPPPKSIRKREELVQTKNRK